MNKQNIETMKQIISDLIAENKERNPYPEDIFPDVEITVDNFEHRRDAMFGSWGRMVWNNCLEDFKRKFDETVNE